MADPTAPPGPPPGPGTAPPFVAAPIEGRRTRTMLLLGLTGAAVLGCCAAGVLATGGFLVLGQQAVDEQIRATVDDYMAAVAEQDWQRAYDQRCAADQQRESLGQYTDRLTDRPAVDSYEVGDPRYGGQNGDGPFAPEAADELAVPVEVAYVDGTGTVLHVPVEQDLETGGFEVCGPVTGE